MVIDRLMTVTAVRAAKITGFDRGTISKAMDLWKASGGRLGLSYVIQGEKRRRRIRLCAIDDWLTRMERGSIYA